jgi:ribosomal protein S18 acetylase RimI-like enzyme
MEIQISTRININHFLTRLTRFTGLFYHKSKSLRPRRSLRQNNILFHTETPSLPWAESKGCGVFIFYESVGQAPPYQVERREKTENMHNVHIEEYSDARHRDQVIRLWEDVFGRASAAHNQPAVSIAKKTAVHDGLFFVATANSAVVGTVMAGYDGHRGWIYTLVVAGTHRHRGIGSVLLTHAGKKLKQLGCLKVNLQIRDGNDAVESFYLKNGYSTEKRISMGKRLAE